MFVGSPGLRANLRGSQMAKTKEEKLRDIIKAQNELIKALVNEVDFYGEFSISMSSEDADYSQHLEYLTHENKIRVKRLEEEAKNELAR